MSTPWFTVDGRRPVSDIRLVAFPFAGGSASVFRNWSTWLPLSVELRAAQLPGRERRISERPHHRIDTLVKAAADALHDEVEPPYALFGHSMGAMVAYELARELAARGDVPPRALIVSGQSPPHVADRRPHIHELDDGPFVDAVRELGGTPPEVFEHAELVELLLPLLRADFEAVETYEWSPGSPLDCPIVVYAGTDDDLIDIADMDGWNEHTADSSCVVKFDGDHFFVLRRGEEVARRAGSDALRLSAP